MLCRSQVYSTYCSLCSVKGEETASIIVQKVISYNHPPLFNLNASDDRSQYSGIIFKSDTENETGPQADFKR